MSLINQALRKAQQDRSPKRMPQPGEAPQQALGPMPSTGIKPGMIIGVLIALAILIGTIAGLILVIFQKDSPTAVASTPAPNQPIMTAPETPAPTPAPAPKPVTQTFTAPSPTPATPTTAESELSVLEELRLAREAAEAKAAEEAADAKRAAEIAAAPPNQAIIDWLSESKVTGVRMSGENSKAVINNKAYEAGELVHYGLGLKLIVIQESRLLFEDANGKRYMKRL